MQIMELEIEVSGDPRRACEIIKDRLELLPSIESAKLQVNETRQGFGEAISVLFATVVLLKLGTASVAQFRHLLRELAGLQKDLTGTQSILVRVGDKKLEPSKVDEAELVKLLGAMDSPKTRKK